MEMDRMSLNASSLRTQGPIPRDIALGHGGSLPFSISTPVVMGPGACHRAGEQPDPLVRRDDVQR
jgi:hypothetical protein